MVIYERKAISLLLLSREPGSASPALTILSQCYNHPLSAPCRRCDVILSRLVYRSRQFWNALFNTRKRIPGDSLQSHLTPAQMSLFRQMQPAEQMHAYQMFKHLETIGQTNPDLLTASLLHDVGKIRYPLSIFDRVIIVLGKRLFPGAARGWAEGTPQGLRRPFVVAEHHPTWGAELASQAGVNSRTVELIRLHQASQMPDMDALTQRLLAALQAADDQN